MKSYVLERLNKFRCHSASRMKRAFFLVFNFVSAQSQGFSNLLRPSVVKNQKSSLRIGDSISLTALTCCALGAAVVLSGCETPYGTPDRTATGALAGGAIGAFSGAVIGGRHAGEGALIGGAIGAITGGLIGHSMDQEEQERLRAEAPVTYVRVEQGQPLAPADVKAMTAAKVGDDVIISQIQSTHSVYHLSAADIIDLHNAGVSEKVIQYMIGTANSDGVVATAAPEPAPVAAPAPAPAPVDTNAAAAPAPAPAPDTNVVAEAPPAPQTEVIVAAPDPSYVWVPGSWQWRGRWVWVGGYWAPPPYRQAVWVPGYWLRGPFGWHWVPGHWR